MQSGVYPETRFDNTPWPATHRMHGLIGQPLGFKSICVFMKGDWMEYASSIMVHGHRIPPCRTLKPYMTMLERCANAPRRCTQSCHNGPRAPASISKQHASAPNICRRSGRVDSDQRAVLGAWKRAAFVFYVTTSVVQRNDGAKKRVHAKHMARSGVTEHRNLQPYTELVLDSITVREPSVFTTWRW
jgi:hypothetical protein